MNHVKFALSALLLALLLPALAVRARQADAPAAPAVQADAKPDRQPDPRADPRADLRPAPTRKPIKRRSVQQVITSTPRIVSGGERPAVAVPAPPTTTMPAPPPTTMPAPAVRLNSCDAGGCTDISGARYNGGVGNTLIGPRGQLCTKGVVSPQCF
ncbi:MAG: hypothetical protein QFF03_18420 [Pseudomonadota bacterium]|nr:hypothetical protein [Pseudomonadota bacterium]